MGGAVRPACERSPHRARLDRLVDYAELDPQADLAVPSPDHYLPLLYAVGAADADDKISFPTEGIARGSMSMRSVLFT